MCKEVCGILKGKLCKEFCGILKGKFAIRVIIFKRFKLQTKQLFQKHQIELIAKEDVT